MAGFLAGVALLINFVFWFRRLRNFARYILKFKIFKAIGELFRLALDISIFFSTMFIAGTVFGLQVAIVLNVGISILIEVMLKRKTRQNQESNFKNKKREVII